MGVPVLGICYGLQYITHHLGGRVESADQREYGHAEVSIVAETPLFAGLPASIDVWMSHGDHAVELPAGFKLTARTSSAVAGIFRRGAPDLCGAVSSRGGAHAAGDRAAAELRARRSAGRRRDWTAGHFIQSTIERVRAQVGTGHAICGLSGGVDSSVAAVLVARAIGDRLTCIFVDNGVLRKDEFAKVQQTMREQLGLKVVGVDASARFLARLVGVTDPEQKRKAIGNEFIAVFDDEAEEDTSRPKRVRRRGRLRGWCRARSILT